MAMIREFEIIAEAVGTLPAVLRNSYPEISWQDIKDFRNLLAHEYFGFDLEIVCDTIHGDLPMSLDAVRKIVSRILSTELSEKEKKTARAVLDGLVLWHQARKLMMSVAA